MTSERDIGILHPNVTTLLNTIHQAPVMNLNDSMRKLYVDQNKKYVSNGAIPAPKRTDREPSADVNSCPMDDITNMQESAYSGQEDKHYQNMPLHLSTGNKSYKNSQAVISNKKSQIPLILPETRTVARRRPKEENKGQSEAIKASATSRTRYRDLGGMPHIIDQVRELIERPLMHPEIFEWLGIQAPSGVLFHGAPGVGKSRLAHAVAGELGVVYYYIAGPEVVSGMSGESEATLRQIFNDAIGSQPSLIVFDEIDAITPKRSGGSLREMEKRIVAQLLSCMDMLQGNRVMIIGITNRLEALDPALRRPGRFDREICLPVPDFEARVDIIRVITSNLRLESSFDFELLASKTPGFVGADMDALGKEAANIAINRVFSSISERKSLNGCQDPNEAIADDLGAEPSGVSSPHSKTNSHASHEANKILYAHRDPLMPSELVGLSFTMQDFILALEKVQPSLRREGFSTLTTNISWDDVGALDSIRQQLDKLIIQPIRSRQHYQQFAIDWPKGVLLYGPPGCGKTLLAKVIAQEVQASFILVQGAELLNKFVGESERAVRTLFQRARSAEPCIIFFDEVDALLPRRLSSKENSVSERVVNQVLSELDGLKSRGQIYILAATNRPDLLDPALLRPGRLDKVLYVPIPTESERLSILQACTRHTPTALDVNLKDISSDPRASGFSGADISALVREASMIALQESLPTPGLDGNKTHSPVYITARDFKAALEILKPSVSKNSIPRYHMSCEIDDDLTI